MLTSVSPAKLLFTCHRYCWNLRPEIRGEWEWRLLRFMERNFSFLSFKVVHSISWYKTSHMNDLFLVQVNSVLLVKIGQLFVFRHTMQIIVSIAELLGVFANWQTSHASIVLEVHFTHWSYQLLNTYQCLQVICVWLLRCMFVVQFNLVLMEQ